MTQINRKSTAFMAAFLVLITGLLIQSHALTQQTVLSVTTSTANSDSTNCRYDLLVGAERRGETTAYAEYTLNARLTGGSDKHSKITATIYLGNSSTSLTLKNASDTWSGTTTHPFAGAANVSVNPKDTSLYTALAATGSGSYKTSREEKYTDYKKEAYTATDKHKVSYIGPKTVTSLGVYQKNGKTKDQWQAYVKEQVKSMLYSHAKSVGHTITSWKVYSYPSGSTGTTANGSYEGYWTEKVTKYKNVPYTATRTVYDTHKTNTGTLGATAGTRPAIEAWYYVKYDANGGQDAPETHGFIGGNSTTISTKQPRYYIASIKKDGYNFVGWKSVGVIRNPELL